MKKRIIFATLVLALSLVACGSNDKTTTVKEDEKALEKETNTELNSEVLDMGYVAYDDTISYITQQIQLGWNEEPEAQELSYIYRYSSPSFGFAKIDINGDGILELALGEDYAGTGAIYDLFTLMQDGTVSHLFCGGERDIMFVSKDLLIEQGSNSADDSFQKSFKIENGLLSLIEEKQNESDTLDKFDYIEFDLFSNYISDTEGDEELDMAIEDMSELDFMPSSEVEVRAGKEEFDSYEEVISYLEPGEGYAYVEVRGTADPVLLVSRAGETYDYGDGVNTNAALSAEVFYKNNRGIVYGTCLYSNSTACPLAIGDGLLYDFGYHEITTHCVSNDMDSFMCMASGIIEYDTDGNATYIGFVREDNHIMNPDEHDITPEEYDALFEAYEKAKVINFTIVE